MKLRKQSTKPSAEKPLKVAKNEIPLIYVGSVVFGEDQRITSRDHGIWTTNPEIAKKVVDLINLGQNQRYAYTETLVTGKHHARTYLEENTPRGTLVLVDSDQTKDLLRAPENHMYEVVVYDLERDKPKLNRRIRDHVVLE
jgi:hypothetical protein